ncbi:hypothetical protein K502DRAFT_350160 [Neoconidiobolus thromboides FSU 785]|nr:hypothetical protein K502DRAFT_350160 [Neoconidiobolus thromboides FSU 785]
MNWMGGKGFKNRNIKDRLASLNENKKQTNYLNLNEDAIDIQILNKPILNYFQESENNDNNKDDNNHSTNIELENNSQILSSDQLIESEQVNINVFNEIENRNSTPNNTNKTNKDSITDEKIQNLHFEKQYNTIFTTVDNISNQLIQLKAQLKQLKQTFN